MIDALAGWNLVLLFLLCLPALWCGQDLHALRVLGRGASASALIWVAGLTVAALL